MSKQQLPTQKGTELWPTVIKSPAIFRHHGIDLMTAEGRAIAQRWEHTAGQFYLAQAQNYALSVNQQSYAQRSEDGVLITYKNEFGRELVDVFYPDDYVAPQDKKEAFPVEEPTKIGPKLAIDVLFTPEAYQLADIYYQETGGGGPGYDWWDTAHWELISGDPGEDWFSGFPVVSSRTYDASPPQEYWWWSGSYTGGTYPMGVTGDINADGYYAASGDQAFYDYGPIDLDAHGPQRAPWIVNAKEVTIDGSYGDDETTARAWGIGGVWSVGGEPPPTHTYYHDTYEYFNTLITVAIRTEDDKNLAWSDKGTKKGVLRSIRAGSPEVERDIDIESSPADEGLWGAGFIAEPGAGEQDVWNFQVWMASSNIIKSNTADGPETSSLGLDDDDPSFSYDYNDEVTLRIRLREYGQTDTIIDVKVNLNETAKITHTVTGDVGEGDPGDSEEVVDVRDLSWGFATKSGWTDEGGEPARPDVDGAGELLDDSGAETRNVVAAPNTEGPTVPTEPVWEGEIDEMTLVATITWTPSTVEGVPGTASVTIT